MSTQKKDSESNKTQDRQKDNEATTPVVNTIEATSQPTQKAAPPPQVSTPSNPNASGPGSSDFISNPLLLIWRGGMKMFERNSNITVVLMVIMFVVSVGFSVFSLIDNATREPEVYIGTDPNVARTLIIMAIIVTISSIFAIFIHAISYIIGIQSNKNKSHSPNEYIEHTLRHFWRMLGFYVLYIPIIVIGFVLFIVPGIYLAYIFSLTPLVILDQNRKIIDSMKESSRLVKNLFWEWLGFSFSYGIISGFIGWAVDVPIMGSFGKFYLQAKAIKEGRLQKTKTHWLNYLIPISMIGFIVMVVMLALFIFFVASFN